MLWLFIVGITLIGIGIALYVRYKKANSREYIWVGQGSEPVFEEDEEESFDNISEEEE